MSAQPQPDNQPTQDNDNLPSTTKEQQRKAMRLLRQLQWLLLLSILAMMLWLYNIQQNFEQSIMGRLQSNEQINTRLNEMDDRLFAISQQTPPKPSQPINNQAQNQLDLLRIQLQAGNRLLMDDDYQAVISLLQGMQWQLSQDNNNISPALTIVLKQSIEQDIDRLHAQTSQPSQWQLQNLAIIDMQTFLRSQMLSASKLPMSNVVTTQQATNHDMTIHEAIMTLNLAMQANNMRDQTLRKMYLQQAKEQLNSLPGVQSRPTSQLNNSGNPDNSDNQDSQLQPLADAQLDVQLDDNSEGHHDDDNNLASMNDVINWLDKLINNPPTVLTLTTTQVLDNRDTTSK